MKKSLLIGLLCFLFPSSVLACSCLTQPPAFAFNDAKVVFIGRMLGGSQKLSLKDREGKTFTMTWLETQLSLPANQARQFTGGLK